MTCGDCIHYEICKDVYVGFEYIDMYLMMKNSTNSESWCGLFKDKSRFIELPCKVGEFRKIEATYKKYPGTEYAIVKYPCKKNKPLKVVSYQIYGVDLISKEQLRVFDYIQSMNFYVVEYGFKTEDKAKARLKELESD